MHVQEPESWQSHGHFDRGGDRDRTSTGGDEAQFGVGEFVATCIVDIVVEQTEVVDVNGF
jgi:hypothetical protein